MLCTKQPTGFFVTNRSASRGLARGKTAPETKRYRTRSQTKTRRRHIGCAPVMGEMPVRAEHRECPVAGCPSHLVGITPVRASRVHPASSHFSYRRAVSRRTPRRESASSTPRWPACGRRCCGRWLCGRDPSGEKAGDRHTAEPFCWCAPHV